MFQYKIWNKFEHKYDIIYLGKCLQDDCRDDYIEEMKRGTGERIKDH